ncbi:MAG: aldolase/citrate lyase family protein [Peptoniphilus sp.]|nr:aldolase/citrate lyase family protein [Peptoniphilus sp.]
MYTEKLRRSLLYVPGTNPKNMIAAQFYGADCIILDLEDSVSINQKDSARNLVFNFLRKERITDTEFIVRVNEINSENGYEDLRAMVLAQPDIIRFPKIERKEDVEKADSILTELEKEYRLEEGTTKIIAGIENFIGVNNAIEIAKASKRTIAISIGGEDYTTSIGAERTREGTELFYGRNMVLMAARLAGIQVFDTVFTNFRDDEGLRADTENIKNLGFDGKYLIHPNQVEIVNSVFTPNEKQIEKAIGILEIIEKAEKDEKGVIKYENEMIDAPIVTRAMKTLQRAMAAGIIKEDINFG